MVEVSDEEIAAFEKQCEPKYTALYQAFLKDENRSTERYINWIAGVRIDASYEETLRQALIRLKENGVNLGEGYEPAKTD